MQVWLAQCQFKVTGWGIMFIYDMVLGLVCWYLIYTPSRVWTSYTADLTTTVVHTCRYKLQINDVKPVHSQVKSTFLNDNTTYTFEYVLKM